MTRFAGVVALLATICLLPAAGAGNSTATALQNAALAWERGDYTSASGPASSSWYVVSADV